MSDTTAMTILAILAKIIIVGAFIFALVWGFVVAMGDRD